MSTIAKRAVRRGVAEVAPPAAIRQITVQEVVSGYLVNNSYPIVFLDPQGKKGHTSSGKEFVVVRIHNPKSGKWISTHTPEGRKVIKSYDTDQGNEATQALNILDAEARQLYGLGVYHPRPTTSGPSSSTGERSLDNLVKSGNATAVAQVTGLPLGVVQSMLPGGQYFGQGLPFRAKNNALREYKIGASGKGFLFLKTVPNPAQYLEQNVPAGEEGAYRAGSQGSVVPSEGRAKEYKTGVFVQNPLPRGRTLEIGGARFLDLASKNAAAFRGIVAGLENVHGIDAGTAEAIREEIRRRSTSLAARATGARGTPSPVAAGAVAPRAVSPRTRAAVVTRRAARAPAPEVVRGLPAARATVAPTTVRTIRAPSPRSLSPSGTESEGEETIVPVSRTRPIPATLRTGATRRPAAPPS